MQTLTLVRRRGWSGRIASLPLYFFLFCLFSLPRPQVELFVRSGPMRTQRQTRRSAQGSAFWWSERCAPKFRV